MRAPATINDIPMATMKAQRPTVSSPTAGTSRSSDEEDRSLCRDGMSAIGVYCRRYYCGASPWRAW